MLLAAAVPARAGERVLEGGSGAGAALLCLAARVGHVQGLGVERDPDLVALARANAQANGYPDLAFVAADLTAMPDAGTFDHAMANPPYHAASGTPSPQAARAQAKQAAAGLLLAWTRALTASLRHHGTLTLVLPAGTLPQCLQALSAAGTPARAVLPLWPKPGEAAKLLLVQGVKGGRSPLRLLPGLVLHEPVGGYTAAAEAVLRDGDALVMR